MTIIDAQIAEGEKFLAHHGVLGMHWGVIRDQAAAGNKGAQKKLAKGDKSWEKELNSTAGFIKVNNRMADYLNGPNGGFAKLNARHPDDVDYTKDSPASRKYFADASKVQNDAFAKSVKDIYGESPSGSKKAIVVIDPATRAPHVEIVDADAQHADDTQFQVPLKTDAKGRIIGISLTPEDTSLAHHGVLGMHWGKRKAKTSASLTPEALAKKERRNKIIVNSAVAAGAIGFALSDKDVRTLIKLSPEVFKRSLGSAALKVSAARGAKAAAHIIADTKGLPKPSAPSVRLGYDVLSNVWKL